MLNQQVKDIPLDYILAQENDIDKVDETKKYKLNDLKLGMRLHSGQVRGIKDTWILIANPVGVELNNGRYAVYGTLVYVGERNKEYEKAYFKYTIENQRPMIIYNEHNEFSEEYLYDPIVEDSANENS